MNASDLTAAADQAFAEGKLQQGLSKLRELSLTDAVNAGSWNRLAMVEEQIGDWCAAGKAHYRCIQLAPHIATSYIYAGYWLQKSNKIDAAAATYSLAQESNPASLDPRAAQSEHAKLRVKEANKLLRAYLSNQHRSLFEDVDNATKIKDAIWPRTHDEPFTYPVSDFAPELFFIPQLNRQAYYNLNNKGWAQGLLKQVDQIKSELAHALASEQADDLLRPYLPDGSVSQGPLVELAGSLNWSALDLYKAGQTNPKLGSMFTKTLDLFDDVPTYALEETPFEIFFSVLKAGQKIAPHYGQSNHSLTVHLPLDIPQNCHLEVAGEQRSWKQGELLVFDDSYLHSAHNNSESDRVVLIFSIWHPHLTPTECNAIQQSFRIRQAWMQQRVSKLQQLIGQ